MTAPDNEQIVLVDTTGKPTGTAPKLASHHGDTPLHLGFSVYIFNQQGELLITQRAHSKKVWPGVWTNSCCGHVAPNETVEAAIKRRVTYELGMTIKKLQVVLPDYRYKTPRYRGVIEHEICPVYFAKTASAPHPNSIEVENTKWMSWDNFGQQAIQDTNDTWSWWCKDQLHTFQQTDITTTIVTYLTQD